MREAIRVPCPGCGVEIRTLCVCHKVDAVEQMIDVLPGIVALALKGAGPNELALIIKVLRYRAHGRGYLEAKDGENAG